MNEGLYDWWIQRLSAILISVFSIPVLFLWYSGHLKESLDWYTFLSSDLGMVLTLLGLVGFAIHAKIGLWVVITDYIPRRMQKAAVITMNIWVWGILGWGLYLMWVF